MKCDCFVPKDVFNNVCGICLLPINKKEMSIDLNQYRGAYKWCDEIIKELEECREKLAVAKEALHKLERESTGFVSMANPADHGNTNIAVMNHWINNAREALAKINEESGRLKYTNPRSGEDPIPVELEDTE